MTKLHYLDGGNPDGPPVVFLHGFLSSNLQWELNRTRLESELRTIYVELPGHGSSPAPVDVAGCTPAVVLSAIDTIRADLDIDQWIVVGQSLGGAIGLRYTLAHPDRVRGVAFTNSRAVFGLSRTGPPSQAPKPQTTRDLRKLPYHPIHAKRFPDELKAGMVAAADAMQPSTVEYLATHSGSWRSVDDLTELSCPVLLVNGTWESAFQPHVARAEDAVADLRVVHLEGGHSINVEQPDAFNEAIVDFVARLTASD